MMRNIYLFGFVSVLFFLGSCSHLSVNERITQFLENEQCSAPQEKYSVQAETDIEKALDGLLKISQNHFDTETEGLITDFSQYFQGRLDVDFLLYKVCSKAIYSREEGSTLVERVLSLYEKSIIQAPNLLQEG